MITRLLRAFVERRIKRPPDFAIGPPVDPYLMRWWLLPRNRVFNIYAHLIVRDDDDRALHDHPWWNLSIILRGGYVEVTRSRHHGMLVRKMYLAGALKARRATASHRIELIRNDKWSPMPALTLFVTGPRIREWGFWCPRGWVSWQEFTAPGSPGEVGRGCGEEVGHG